MGAPPLGEILVQAGKVPPQKVAEALVKQMTTGKAPPDSSVPDTVKVDISKVDNLVDLMGELVIVQSQVRQNGKIGALADQKLERDLGQMARITSELQKISMSMRMVPIGATFRKMMRLVRDLSHKVGKEVDLRLEGEDTEIDRSMVEAIYDPLVHLVRNSVDHGLETPADREAAGKPATGVLYLRSFHQGGDIIIEIEDDGRGLNREAILAKAVERGLVPPGQTISPERIDHLIFEPGFSTAAAVTEISGRGVGLDVVKQAINHLRGKIDICSRVGEGCRFLLRLPLTLAIIDGMVVQVGTERYIVPTVGVQETLRPAPRTTSPSRAKGSSSGCGSSSCRWCACTGSSAWATRPCPPPRPWSWWWSTKTTSGPSWWTTSWASRKSSSSPWGTSLKTWKAWPGAPSWGTAGWD